MSYEWDYLDKQGYNNRTGHYKSEVQFKFISENCGEKVDNILDIAGGAGRFAIPLLKYSNDITVLDINEEALRRLKERTNNITTICGNFTEVEFKQQYAVIICIEALFYFEDWLAFFTKISSLLKEDGKFIFTYTNTSSWRSLIKKMKHLIKPNPFIEMDFKKLKTILTQCNLEIDNVNGMNWLPLSVTSDSIMVDFFVFIEKTFRLNKWQSQSPWLLLSVKKRTTIQ